MMSVEDFIAEWNNSEEYIPVHTSGSTGNPKDIKLSKSLVRDSAIRTINYFGINRNSHLHLCLSPDYIAGKMMIVRSILSGAKLSIQPPSNDIMITEGDVIDLIAVVPSQLVALLDDEVKMSAIRNMIVGGASIPDTLRVKLAMSEVNAFETYGMTETASHVALRKVDMDLSNPFCALPGIKFSTDSSDRLIIDLGNCYDKIITNDVVDLIDNQRFYLLGRIDNVIISGGVKIHPAIIEQKICHLLPPNTQFYISSIPHEKWGEEVVLIIESSAEILYLKDRDEAQSLLLKIKELLPAYHNPKQIFIVDNFKRTDSGKIIRRKMNEVI